MRIEFLIQNFYGVGGTNTAVHNLASALAVNHNVEVVSVFRRQDSCAQDAEGRYSVRSLVDVRAGRPDATSRLRKEPSSLVPPAEELYAQYSALTDRRIQAYLRQTRADVVIGTRPSLNLFLAQHGRADYLKISQEHMTQDLIPASVAEEIRSSYASLDAAVCLTVADSQVLEQALSDPDRPMVVAIPNAVPAPQVRAANGLLPTIVAAGRLADVKRYDMMIRAFGHIAESFPQWSLRLYGAGSEVGALRGLIHALGLQERVLLMGRAVPLETEWVKGSIAACSSSHESFGMTIVESMRCGLPVVSTACPVGPAEIIEDGQDGLLVPVGDTTAFAMALASLMEDEGRRVDMGAAALRNSQRFDPSIVAQSYEELFATLPRVAPSVVGKARRSGRQLADAARVSWSDLRASVRSRGRRVLRSGPTSVNEPVIDCTMREDGTLAFSTLGSLDAVGMTLRLRDQQAEHRVPFDVAAQAASLESHAAVQEGRWNVFVEEASGRRRARAGRLDTRVMAGEPCLATDGPIRMLLPYSTADGYLAVRSWQRAVHAECRRLDLHGDQLRLEIDMYGVEPYALTMVVARRSHPMELVFPVTPSRDSSRGAAEIPLSELARCRLTRHDDWDLWVTTVDGTKVRVARLLDDVPDRKAVYTQPLLTIMPPDELPWVEESPGTPVRVRPYFTVDSGLSIYVAD